jgi:acyl-CoA synthetase (AMP-forming)/AMP-acid ligase II
MEKCLAARPRRSGSLADALAPGLALRPDEAAIFFEDRRLTYRAVDDAANCVANALGALGVRTGDRVGIHLDNRPEFVEAYQGVMRTGATLVPANVMYTEDELLHILGDSEASVVFVRSDLAHKIHAIRDKLPALRHVIEVCGRRFPDFIDFDDMKARAESVRPNVVVDPESLAFIQYTSGTTGKPKGAMVTHANVLAVIDNTLDMPGFVEVLESDVMLLVLPLFHAYALNLAMNRAFL